jgi:hypothetical protein
MCLWLACQDYVVWLNGWLNLVLWFQGKAMLLADEKHLTWTLKWVIDLLSLLNVTTLKPKTVLFFLMKIGSGTRSNPKFGWRREVLVILMPGKKVPGRRPGLRPSEKELREWRSGAFRHKMPLPIDNTWSYPEPSVLSISTTCFLEYYPCLCSPIGHARSSH